VGRLLAPGRIPLVETNHPNSSDAPETFDSDRLDTLDTADDLALLTEAANDGDPVPRNQ
jgi:hypothetical protein